jgi:hypothetical protein
MSDRPTLTQVQIIQSLAEALSWFEKEIAWGVSPGELNHLTGRIGELYAAMITRGQMALDTNQRGYDVVSAENERISVKTVTSTKNITFNPNTFDKVDRVMILRVNVDDEKGISVEEIFDGTTDEANARLRSRGKALFFSIARSPRTVRPLTELQVIAKAAFRGIEIVQYENGAVRICKDDIPLPVVVKDRLKPIAIELGVDILNTKGSVKNTQQLGNDIIRRIHAAKLQSNTLW